MSEKVREQYDLIGFDPRGVGASDGIRCLDDEQTDQYLSEDDGPGVDVGKREEEMSTVAKACQKNSAAMLPVMDTLSAARDMDVIRAVVGSDKLDYLGFSYGTYLGQTYADTYPSRVGRMVLDGVMDPALDGDQISAGQAQGFENALGAFAQWCAKQKECAFSGGRSEMLSQLRAMLDGFEKTPLQTGDPERPLTKALATSAVIMPMYADEMWPQLSSALIAAKKGDGKQLLRLADLSNERDEHGHYSGNSTFSILAVNCLDHPVDQNIDHMKAEAKSLAAKYPTVGEDMAYGGVACKQWPAKPVRTPAPIHAKGAAPIMLIGTTGDPATPYAWAQNVRKAIPNSRLITFEGNGHTAYGRSGPCVADAVDRYLVDGAMPKDDLTCK